MKRSKRELGFALPAAIFVVVVLGASVLAMSNINAVQSSAGVLGIQGSRAYWAARSGVDWGIYQVDSGGVGAACFSNTTLSSMTDGLANFSVDVSCSRVDYKEGSSSANVYIYDITAEATYGSGPSSPDYVYRKVQATLSVK